jgi:hypothetical protein
MPETPIATRSARRCHGLGRVVALLLTLALVTAACGGGDDAETLETPSPSAEATATAAPEAPTATAVPSPTPVPDFDPDALRSPLNGSVIDEPSTTRLLAVKIDNHANARPQSGIQHADMMVEIWVEGITRFLSVWQDSDAEVLGPIRSMRPTDFSIQNSWSSYFVNSGGQGWVQAIGNASNVDFYVEPAGSYRVNWRSAPHNVYGSTEAFRALNRRGDYDEPLAPLWTFGLMPDDAGDASDIANQWPGNYTTAWHWNGTEYERDTVGAPHMYFDDDGEAQRVTADTLVMFEMPISSQSGGAGTSAVPVTNTVGSGPAWVFANGRVEQARGPATRRTPGSPSPPTTAPTSSSRPGGCG